MGTREVFRRARRAAESRGTSRRIPLPKTPFRASRAMADGYTSPRAGRARRRSGKSPSAGGEPVQVSARPGQVSIESVGRRRSLLCRERDEIGPDRCYANQPKAARRSRCWTTSARLGSTLSSGGIYYIERVGNDARLRYFDFGSGISTLVARNLGATNIGLTATRDGRVDSLLRVPTQRSTI